MKIKPVEMGLEVEGHQSEVPEMLNKLAEYASDFGYAVDKIEFEKDYRGGVSIKIEFDQYTEFY